MNLHQTKSFSHNCSWTYHLLIMQMINVFSNSFHFLHSATMCLLLPWWFHMMTSSNRNFPSHWPFVRGIHLLPVNSPHNGQWREALVFSLIHAWTNGWVNNHAAGDLRRHCAHYDVTVLIESIKTTSVETVNTGILDKNKEHYLRSTDKAEKYYDKSRHIQLHMSKYKTKWWWTWNILTS